MLELRPICENCGKALPANSAEAMICSFECTFCRSCVQNTLHNVCPNCGGGFEKRPIRPKQYLEKNPMSVKIVFKPVHPEQLAKLWQRYKDMNPEQR